MVWTQICVIVYICDVTWCENIGVMKMPCENEYMQ